jgi:hypothetical protein
MTLDRMAATGVPWASIKQKWSCIVANNEALHLLVAARASQGNPVAIRTVSEPAWIERQRRMAK